MNKVSSAYLEVIRIVAATYVFIYHFSSEKIGNTQAFFVPGNRSNFWLSYNAAHFFVIVFFVLSGFLITMSASRPGLTFKTFLIARIGRLYSVIIPSLIFTYFVFAFMVYFKHAAIADIEGGDHLFIRFLVNLMFMTQSWNLCSTPPFNGPFWSVNYEFFYYLLMGSILLIKRKYKFIVFTLVALLAGLKILILFPAWLAGSLLYYCSRNKLIGAKISGVVFLVTLALIFFNMLFPGHFPFIIVKGDRLLGTNLFFSWNYRNDYIFCILVAVNIYSFFGISEVLSNFLSNRGLGKLFHSIKTVGNCTYTLYLFHVPLLFLFAFLFPYNKANTLHQLCLILSVTIAVYFIATITEWRVSFWRNFVAGLFNSNYFDYLKVKFTDVKENLFNSKG
ncbi:acyltransferase family protein [Mucilaginibacter sp. OK098]|uniref:acyltransferase family protein n=1 Tax=Mucilaginibacter sp. OK098 TaxID=1855297 RepID=UPI000917B991|nr:acyltransferase [Mucilaginibacter sp. OK098]SHN19557.1 Peptidoglycan/LPS O-acetylase OafA/YrhL, contains acyltransferase and SGNH-hydrolase domains [Mucilaginibacter sp. OK098]